MANKGASKMNKTVLMLVTLIFVLIGCCQGKGVEEKQVLASYAPQIPTSQTLPYFEGCAPGPLPWAILHEEKVQWGNADDPLRQYDEFDGVFQGEYTICLNDATTYRGTVSQELLAELCVLTPEPGPKLPQKKEPYILLDLKADEGLRQYAFYQNGDIYTVQGHSTYFLGTDAFPLSCLLAEMINTLQQEIPESETGFPPYDQGFPPLEEWAVSNAQPYPFSADCKITILSADDYGRKIWTDAENTEGFLELLKSVQGFPQEQFQVMMGTGYYEFCIVEKGEPHYYFYSGEYLVDYYQGAIWKTGGSDFKTRFLFLYAGELSRTGF